ncbi:MAG: aldolase catalytic domain-containing protein [Heyndrickxia sp.]
MNNVQILDCTLRDGGYINDWNFGERTIEKVILKLSQANIDIIECGFLRDAEYDENKSVFNNVNLIKKYIEPKNNHVQYVAMIDQPYISIDQIGVCDGTSIDGIRVTFHGDDAEINEAFVLGKQLMDKGYKVFMQPVGTTSYSDEELLQLVNKINLLKPYAFYLVDTLGVMYKNDLLRMFHLIDNNLDPSICIGFHSHNNLQLSFANAQELMTLHTKRNIIIDSSVFGMGRGAGNLCTELIAQYINNNIGQKYHAIPLLEIVDEYLSPIYEIPKWGYSVPYFLSAINGCHPNYASYLLNKQTFTVKTIHAILKQLPHYKKDIYDEAFVEELYINYQIQWIDDSVTIEKMRSLTGNKQVLILGAGKSIVTEKEKIDQFIFENDPYVISVNFIPEMFNCDATFISNNKRFNRILEIKNKKQQDMNIIYTSNIKQMEKSGLIVNYTDLLVDDPMISDNAGLMLLNLLNRLSIRTVYLAGFDGFSKERTENYFTADLVNSAETENLIRKNEAIQKQLRLLDQRINILFVTDSIYLEKDKSTHYLTK